MFGVRPHNALCLLVFFRLFYFTDWALCVCFQFSLFTGSCCQTHCYYEVESIALLLCLKIAAVTFRLHLIFNFGFHNCHSVASCGCFFSVDIRLMITWVSIEILVCSEWYACHDAFRIFLFSIGLKCECAIVYQGKWIVDMRDSKWHCRACNFYFIRVILIINNN